MSSCQLYVDSKWEWKSFYPVLPPSKMVLSLKNSVYSRLAKYETNTFKIAAALDPRWKLDWCTPAEKEDIKNN